MTIVTLLYLSGAITGTVVGEAYKPLSLPLNNNKECTTYSKKVKEYNFEINDYIEKKYQRKDVIGNHKTDNSINYGFISSVCWWGLYGLS